MTDLVDDGTTPTLEELLEFALLAWQKRIRVAIPARVRSFDASDQTVEVELMTSDVARQVDGTRREQPLPVIPDVPVVFPRGGQFFLSFPLAAGDTGQLVICDRAIGKWRSTGNGGDPGDLRMHSLGAGSVFYPGLSPDSRALANFDTTSITMGREGGPSVHVTATDVRLGSASAAEAVVLGTSMQSGWSAARATLNAIPAAGDLATTATLANGLKVAVLALVDALQLATKVKAE